MYLSLQFTEQSLQSPSSKYTFFFSHMKDNSVTIVKLENTYPCILFVYFLSEVLEKIFSSMSLHYSTVSNEVDEPLLGNITGNRTYGPTKS